MSVSIRSLSHRYRIHHHQHLWLMPKLYNVTYTPIHMLVSIKGNSGPWYTRETLLNDGQ